MRSAESDQEGPVVRALTPVLVVNFVDGADVGVIQSGCGLGFALEAGQGLRIFRNLVRQELQGNKAVQLYVFGFVDDAHTTTAQLLNDAVMRDGLSDHQGIPVPSGRFILRTRHLPVNEC